MHDTAVLLSRHFMKERLQYGLYGLYPKYRIYNEPLTVFLGMVGHALVVLTLQADRGSLADQCESIFLTMNPWNLAITVRTLSTTKKRKLFLCQCSSSVRENLASIKRNVCSMDYSVLDKKLAGAYGRVDPAVDGRQIGVTAMDYHRWSLCESDNGNVHRVRPFYRRHHASVE